MTNSERFIIAHKTAKQIRDCFSSYRGAFAFALKEIYAMERAQKTQTTVEKTTAEKLEALGIDVWERGEMKRYYVDEHDIPRVFNAVVRHGRRAVKVYVAGQYGYGLTKATELNRYAAIYYDANAKRWMQGHDELCSSMLNALRI